MKRSEFIRWLQENGCTLHRNGGRHDIYINLQNGKKQPVPRHNEIDDMLVKHIRLVSIKTYYIDIIDYPKIIV